MFDADLISIEKQTVHYTETVAIKLPRELDATPWSYEMRIAMAAAWKAGEECLLPLRAQVVSDAKGSEPQSSEADFASNNSIFRTLNRAFPEDGFISQEGAPFEVTITDIKRSWVVDPLDGTAAYSSGESDVYGIHIALVDHATGDPLLGVNYYPALDTTYFAIKGHGAYKQVGRRPAEKLHVNTHSNEIKAYTSTKTPLIEKIYENLGNVSFSKCLSCGLRICSLIDTPNNLYITSGNNTLCGKESGPVRFTATWDIASGGLILSEAGGVLGYIDGSKIDYLASDGRLKQTVIVTSDPILFDRIQKIYH